MPLLVSVGQFANTAPLAVIDLAALPEIPSIFDEERRHIRPPLWFLYEFSERISAPVRTGARSEREAIEYVPTQIVSEYFRTTFGSDFGQPVAGLLYKSAARARPVRWARDAQGRGCPIHSAPRARRRRRWDCRVHLAGRVGQQAEYLYDGERAPRLLDAASEGAWAVDTRPHLAFWHSKPPERLYMNPEPTMTVEEYVARWAGEDGKKVGGHDPATVRGELWPWLIKRGYASEPDEELLEPFLDRVAKRNRDVHLRPGSA